MDNSFHSFVEKIKMISSSTDSQTIVLYSVTWTTVWRRSKIGFQKISIFSRTVYTMAAMHTSTCQLSYDRQSPHIFRFYFKALCCKHSIRVLWFSQPGVSWAIGGNPCALCHVRAPVNCSRDAEEQWLVFVVVQERRSKGWKHVYLCRWWTLSKNYSSSWCR